MAAAATATAGTETNETNETSVSVVAGNVTLDLESALLPPYGYYLVGTVLICVMLFGFISNSLLIWTTVRVSNFHNTVQFMFVNVGVSNCLMAVTSLPLAVISSFLGRWPFGRSGCVWYGFSASIYGIVAVSSYTILLLYWYARHCTSIGEKLRRNTKWTFPLVTTTWFYAIFLTLPPLFGWNDFELEPLKISCSIEWEARAPKAMSYTLCLFSFAIFVPIASICVSSALILGYLRKKTSSIAERTASEADRKVTRVIIYFVAAFALCWIPYTIYASMVAFGGRHFISIPLATAVSVFAKSNIVYSPVILASSSKNFRAAIRETVDIICFCRMPDRDVQNELLELEETHHMSSIP